MTRVVTVISTATLDGRTTKVGAVVTSAAMAASGTRYAAAFSSVISIYARSVCAVAVPFQPVMWTISRPRNTAEQMKTATWRRYVGLVTRQKQHGNE